MFKLRVALPLAAIAAVAALALGGCGSSDESSRTAATADAAPLTKPQYVKQAQQICLEEIGQLEKLVQTAIVANSKIKTEQILPRLEAVAERLGSLEVAPGARKSAEAFLLAFERDLNEVRKTPAASTEELAIDFLRSGNLARKTDIEACGLG